MFGRFLFKVSATIFGLSLISTASSFGDQLNAQDEIVKAVLSATGIPSAPTDQSDYLQRAANQVILPNNLTGDQWLVERLKDFDRVPTGSGDGKFEDGGSMPERLSGIGALIEFSSLSLNDDQKSELRDAQKVLYADILNLLPSQAYLAYTKYKSDYDDLSSQLASAPAQQRPLILGRMRQVERDWTLFGHRSEIDTALSITQKYQEGNAAALFKAWLSSLPEAAAISPSILSDALPRTDWVKITRADDAVKRAGSLVGGQTTLDLPPLTRLSFEFQIVRLNRPALRNPFLENRTWRLKNGQLLSGGANPSVSLIPRYISSLLLIRNVEMVFETELKSGAFAAIASSSPTIALSNLAVRSDNRGCLVYQSKYVLSCAPVVLGYIISHMPTVPNPDPNRTFKAN